jgi:hypothetical protein
MKTLPFAVAVLQQAIQMRIHASVQVFGGMDRHE